MLLNSLFKHWSYRFFAPGIMARHTYEAFKRLLVYDGRCHDLMAELDVLYHDGRREDFSQITRRYEHFAAAVSGMIESFAVFEPASAAALLEYYKKFNFYIRYLLAPPEQLSIPPYVVNLDTVPEVELAGHKAHNLALLHSQLKLPVPPGFVITTNSYYALLEHNNLRPAIDDLLAEIDLNDSLGLVQLSAKLESLIKTAEIPLKVKLAILTAYEEMEKQYGAGMLTAVRSSAISEDSEYSFAGQYRTVLAVKREAILLSYLNVAASKYSPEALFYRVNLGLADEEAPIAVLVLAMVEAAASGIVYTSDPVAKARDMLVIHAVHGLGEPLAGGAVSPDVFSIARCNQETVRKLPGRQKEELLLHHGKLAAVPLTDEAVSSPTLSDSEVRRLASWGMAIEKLSGSPQDVEWAKTRDDKLFLLQARPLSRESVHPPADKTRASDPALEPLLHGGQRAAGGKAAGMVYLAGTGNLDDMPSGAVLVTSFTPPSIVRVMNRLAAVVADEGSTAGHFATVCREFGVPLLVDTRDATTILTPGQVVTVDADERLVYAGRIESLLQGDGAVVNISNLPYFKKLRAILDFITPLKLIDAGSADFRPSSCRSMHDIIRYTHEQAVQAMFSLGDRISGSSGRSRKLQTDLPLEVYLLDVGGGIDNDTDAGSVLPEQVNSIPFGAVWRGISQAGIDWHSHSHFDWKNFDDVALAGGMAMRNAGDYASYAIIGRDYLNFNMRFGYHFTLVDALCGRDTRGNYCQFRFAGGGGEYSGRVLRIEFVTIVLRRLGFEVDSRADLLDARISGIEYKKLEGKLELLGTLLGSTKLMDMILKEKMDVRPCVERFFAGEYNFSSLRGKAVDEQ
ncbi:PEP/pyruvate-binding domain-containing protein [Desulfobacterota bacterium M19]